MKRLVLYIPVPLIGLGFFLFFGWKFNIKWWEELVICAFHAIILVATAIGITIYLGN